MFRKKSLVLFKIEIHTIWHICYVKSQAQHWIERNNKQKTFDTQRGHLNLLVELGIL